MNAFQVFTYAAIVDKLNAGESVSPWYLYSSEWRQLGEYLPLEIKNVVRLATPDVLPALPADSGRNSELDDWQFEESRDHMFKQGRLQR